MTAENIFRAICVFCTAAGIVGIVAWGIHPEKARYAPTLAMGILNAMAWPIIWITFERGKE